MRIGEVAARAGTTPKAVRYYESLGLITPGRLGNGYRDYSEHDLRLVCEIRALLRLGIPLERTVPFLQCLIAGHAHGDDCPASLATYRDAIAELDERIDGLATKRAALSEQLRQAARRGGDWAAPALMPEPGVSPAALPVPVDDGAAGHLSGSRMPRMDLPSTTGTRVALHALGPGRTVLYLYPLTGRPETDLPEGWDAIPGARGCTPQACGFRDHHGDLIAAGAGRVFGLSSQDSDYQREVVARLRLPFAMLSDPGLAFAGRLRLPLLVAGGMTLYKRLTLIVRAGVIEHVFYPVFPPGEHARQVLAWLGDHRGPLAQALRPVGGPDPAGREPEPGAGRR